jgi:hypothetical protein
MPWMKRREFITLLGGAVLPLALRQAAHAAPPGRSVTIGVIAPLSFPALEGLRRGFREWNNRSRHSLVLKKSLPLATPLSGELSRSCRQRRMSSAVGRFGSGAHVSEASQRVVALNETARKAADEKAWADALTVIDDDVSVLVDIVAPRGAYL